MAIKDLTNTTWVVPAGWSATAGYGRFPNIVYTANSDYFIDHYTTGFYIGYNGDFNDNFVTPTTDVIVIGSYGQFYDTTKSLTFTFESGADVTNPVLISWLEANGECQNPPGPEEPAVTIEYNGSVIATLAKGVSTLPCEDKVMHTNIVITVPKMSGEAISEWDGSYTVSGGMISFTIDGVTYEAEDGMTFYEFAVSDYNNGDIWADNIYYNPVGGKPIFTEPNCTYDDCYTNKHVRQDTVIEGGHAYYSMTGGF